MNYVSVRSGGHGVAAHVGLHALGTLADQLGLGASLSSRSTPRGERAPLHDRGKVLVQLSLVLAGGGESCADIEHPRAQEEIFGSVPSDSGPGKSLRQRGTPSHNGFVRADPTGPGTRTSPGRKRRTRPTSMPRVPTAQNLT